jgi:hypothetical protein
VSRRHQALRFLSKVATFLITRSPVNTVCLKSSFAFDNNALEFISSFDFIMTGSRLILKVDPDSSGNWVDCVTIDNLDLPTGWVDKSRFGISATTGL